MLLASQTPASQRSLHNAPIFRLLLKVAVNGTHQCDLLNFCGAAKLQQYSIVCAVVHHTMQSCISKQEINGLAPFSCSSALASQSAAQ
jgi:hypothetical protein